MDYLGPATEYLCRVSRKKARLCKAITSRNCNSAARRRHDGRRYHEETWLVFTRVYRFLEPAGRATYRNDAR